MTDEREKYSDQQLKAEFLERQLAYEKNLGKFLVAFNRVEQCTYEIVVTAFELKGLKALSKETRTHFMTLNKCREILELLQKDIDDLGSIDVKLIKKLATDRNQYGHGAFLLEIKGGEPAYVVRGKNEDPKTTDPKILDELAHKANDLGERMEHLLISLRIKALRAPYDAER